MAGKTEEKVQQLQLIEQNVQNFSLQRQNIQLKIMEIDSALKELEGAKDAYRIIGNVMVLSDKDELVRDLTSKKETAELRIKSIERQETKLMKTAEEIRQEVLGEIKDAPE